MIGTKHLPKFPRRCSKQASDFRHSLVRPEDCPLDYRLDSQR
jgi:hypothetical protein